MALSPAVNDPNTAVQVIEEMTFLFEGLAKHDLGSYEMSTGESTVTVRSRSFSYYLVLATEQIALYGKDDPFVMGALERMGASLAVLDLPPESAAAVEAFADRVLVAAQ